MKKLTKLFSAIAMLSVLAFVGCADPNNTKTDKNTPAPSTSLDGYYNLNSRTIVAPDGKEDVTPGDHSIYVMKNGKISFPMPSVEFSLNKDNTLNADFYTQDAEGNELKISATGTWGEKDNKLTLTASISSQNQNSTFTYEITKNNDISWPTAEDFAKVDGIYSSSEGPGQTPITITDGKFNYGNRPVVLKEDGTLTCTELGKEVAGYWFMKDANTLALSVSKSFYAELTKNK